MFHVGLKFSVGAGRWYTRVSAHMLRYVTTRTYNIKLSVDKIIIIIIEIIITIIINKN